MFCNTVYSNAYLEPSELKYHFNKRHGVANVLGHDLDSFIAKRIRYESRRKFPKFGFISAGKPLLLASDQVAYNVAKSKKPHRIAEKLIKPCVLQMTNIILVKEA